MSNPQAGDVPISQPAYDALVDMTRYGGAVLGWDGETLRAYDPISWYPTLGGDVFVRPFTSVTASDANNDAVNVLTTAIDGDAISSTYDWQTGQIGKLRESESAGPISVLVVPRSPTNGIWGTAKYTELCDPIIEIARRFSSKPPFARPVQLALSRCFRPVSRTQRRGSKFGARGVGH